ncbi:hypothetical protein [uncultured Psychroserpens sp.]|uniref:leucine-rich repeat domain-containing protein n=1 Tax=uncultured Psychroserpens sp. TaxID=255436 RepID=UPI0026360FC8|nr:hypothetical protein [uncultured Psychroserpens sp.]
MKIELRSKMNLKSKHLARALKCIAVFFLTFIVIGCSSSLSDEELKERYDKALEAKNWKAVIELLDEIIEREPNDKNTYYTRALAKSNLEIPDPKGVAEDLTTYLSFDPNSYQALYVRFQAYSVLGEYDKALEDIDKIIKLKGKTAFLLAWKGNCAFAAKKFDVAEKTYEERLRLPGGIEDLKNTYYYWVFSKYFGGNKESALWDVAFLEDRGLKADHDLMRLIEEDKLVFEELAQFELTQMSLEQLEEVLNNYCASFDIFEGESYFRSGLLNRFARLEKTEDLNALLDQKEEVYALNLSYSDFSELPKTLTQFINLQYLNISGTRFKDKEQLFEDLSKLPNLRILIAYRCNLRKLPDNIKLLQNVEMLDIGTNGLRELNENIGALTKLKYLSVRSNSYLKDLPKSIENLRCLQFLNVSGSGMTRLRDELSNCSELVSIVANASKIKTIPEQIGNLINLKHINLGHNKIESIPESIGKLSDLEHLGLGSNDIRKLPKEFSNLENLGFLSLAYNRFDEFPKEVLGLNNVYNLWVHNSSFKIIPSEVGKMESLTHLLVDHQVISNENIEAIKTVNPALRVIREDNQKYVKTQKRKN